LFCCKPQAPSKHVSLHLLLISAAGGGVLLLGLFLIIPRLLRWLLSRWLLFLLLLLWRHTYLPPVHGRHARPLLLLLLDCSLSLLPSLILLPSHTI
jgi:hypothetical protein